MIEADVESAQLTYESIADVDIPEELQPIIDLEESIWALNPQNVVEIGENFITLIKRHFLEPTSALKIIDYACQKRPKLVYTYLDLFEYLKTHFNFPKFSDSNFLNSLLFEKNEGKNQMDTFFPSLFPEQTIGYYIQTDDIDKVIQETKDPSFDFNKPIERRKRHIFFGNDQYNPIELAAKHGSINCFKFLMMNKLDLTDRLVTLSVEGGNIEIIRILQQNGADFKNSINAALSFHHEQIHDWIVNNYGFEGFYVQDCLEFYFHKALIYYLENKGDINFMHNNATPLCRACMNNFFIVIKYIIEQGADVNKFSNILTPLSIACDKNNINAIKYLLDHGSEPNVKVEIDKTPLTIAIENDAIDVVQMLIDKGAKVNENVLLGIQFIISSENSSFNCFCRKT